MTCRQHLNEQATESENLLHSGVIANSLSFGAERSELVTRGSIIAKFTRVWIRLCCMVI